MKVSSFVVLAFISLASGHELQKDKHSTENGTRKEDNDGKGQKNPWKREAKDEICNAAKDVSVQSAYVAQYVVQLFIENLDGSMGWTTDIKDSIGAADKYPRYIAYSSTADELGQFQKISELPASQELKNDGKFKRVTASFLDFSNSDKEKAYLVMGLKAYEFEIDRGFYFPTGNVKSINFCNFLLISDFFNEDQKLLKPEDKLEAVISVSLIKWVEKDEIKDHALYKIVFKTVTKKLVKAYFKLTSKGKLISLDSEPFVPSAEVMDDEDEFKLLEESALYYVRYLNTLSMGYQFTKTLAFPIYYNYNPEANTYKEYPMRTKEGFNAELETLGNKIPYLSRYIVPTETWLGCPETKFCLGRSFYAVFFVGNQYYAIFGKIVYKLESMTSTPGIGLSFKSLFPVYLWYNVDAAFALGAMVFFISADRVYYMTDIGAKSSNMLGILDVFPKMDISSTISAVITLDKEKEVSANERHERETPESKDDIPQKMVYLYCSSGKGGNVYQFEMETKEPPKFKLLAKKPFEEVNAALPLHIQLVFTADDKVVTMVNHFMIEQSSHTFFTKTENVEKFTLINKYFGCNSANIENKLTKEFVQKYVEFAGPKPGVNIYAYPADTRDSTEPAESTSEGNVTEIIDTSSSKSSDEMPSSEYSKTVSSTEETLRRPSGNDEDKNDLKGSGMSARISTLGFIIHAVVLVLIA